MTNPINIFDVAPRYDGNFFLFKQVGDAIQGTFVSLYEAVDGYSKEQYVLVLMDNKDNNIYHKVGIGKDSTVLVDQLQKVKLGQIIGFRYAEERPSKRYPGKNVKIIKLHEHYTLVDSEWMQAQIEKGFHTAADFEEPALPKFETLKAKEATVPFSSPVAATPVQSVPVFNSSTVNAAPVLTTNSVAPDVIKTMINLAVSNGHIDDMLTEESSLKEIEKVTNLTITTENVSQIVNILAIKKA